MAKPGRPETDLETLQDILRSGIGKIEWYLRKLPADNKLYLNKIEATCLLMGGATKNYRKKVGL